jgi:D-alanyl-D-alanine carboxypeptidase
LFICAVHLMLAASPDAEARRPRQVQPEYRSAVVMNAATGEILYQKDADRPVQPASVTKILSLYLIYEAIGEGRVRFQDPVKISKKAWRTGGSRMFVDPGSEVPLDELIKGMSVVSANDASVALAEYMGGSEDAFVKKMNWKARQLGMTRSTFKNPHGLPAKGQRTTARDMAKLSRVYIQRFPQSLQIHAMQSYTYHNITQYNHNLLLKRFPNADGLKTGYVHAAGYHIIATARRGDIRLIALVMGSRTPGIRLRETAKLLDQGFARVSRQASAASRL